MIMTYFYIEYFCWNHLHFFFTPRNYYYFIVNNYDMKYMKNIYDEGIEDRKYT